MGPVEDLEIQRRSLAMLPPGAPGLRREDALALIGRLQAAEQRIVDLERELHRSAASRHPSSGRGV